MSLNNDRKLELERKKAKLAEIREAKRRKEEERAKLLLNQQQQNENRESSVENPIKSALVEETEKILSELGISPHAPETPVHEATPPPPGAGPRGSSTTPDSSGAGLTGTTPTTVYKTRGRISLDRAILTPINIQPREQVHYSKATQTLGAESGSSVDNYPVHHFEWDDEFTGVGAPRTAPSSAGTQCSPVEEVFPSLGLDAHQLAAGLLLPHVELVKPTEVISEKTIQNDKERTLAIQLISDEEKQKILVQPEFRQFLDKSAKILERALTEKEDSIFVDYSQNERSMEKEVDFDQKMSLNRTFFDEKWSKSRCVTCMDYSPQHPELLAVSYNNNEEAPNEPEGVVLVWNNKFKKTTPEYVFHCQSRVLSISWAKFHPNLLLGGTYSGQICLWDNRQNKRTPVQKSPLSASAHTHPVYCLKVVGTQNAHNLITASTDGKLCSWSLDMLAKPMESVDLQLKQSKQVAATCFDFPPNDVNSFFVGSEDSSVYACCRHGMGQKGGGGLLETTSPFDGHHGPVTGLSCHAANNGETMGGANGDFSQLFLTSSFDWTIKLWNAKESNKPLCSFEDNSDYVMDVRWSPVHPALFTAGDCRGRLDLWHLNKDTELPTATINLPDETSINKLMWLQSGTQLAVGDDQGHVYIYDVNEQLATPKPNDWNQFAKVLDDIKQNQLEAEELMQAMSLSNTPIH